VTLRGNLHAHSTCSDGRLTPREVVRAYADLGYDFVALTDHDHLFRPHCYDDLGETDGGILVFLGMELTVFEKGYFHVNRIQGREEVLHFFNHPGEYGLPYEKVLDRIAAIRTRLPLDAVEVSSKGFYTAEYDVPAIPYPKLASDDSHNRYMCGRAWIEVDCEKDKDAILRAIKAGKAVPRFAARGNGHR
jgi:hypothetical protein